MTKLDRRGVGGRMRPRAKDGWFGEVDKTQSSWPGSLSLDSLLPSGKL